MKLKNINAEIVKAYHKTNARFLIGKYDSDKFIISYDGVVAYIIASDDFIFNTTKLLRGDSFVDRLSLTVDNASVKAEEVTLTDNLKIQDKRELVELKNDTVSVWINRKLLNNFEPTRFYCKSPKSPVVVYEGEDIAGIILPVRIQN